MSHYVAQKLCRYDFGINNKALISTRESISMLMIIIIIIYENIKKCLPETLASNPSQ